MEIYIGNQSKWESYRSIIMHRRNTNTDASLVTIRKDRKSKIESCDSVINKAESRRKKRLSNHVRIDKIREKPCDIA